MVAEKKTEVKKPSPVERKAEKAVSAEPKVDGFKIKTKLKGSFKDVSELLRTISFLEIAAEKDAVNVVYVESRDIKKNPYLFSILKIKKNEMEVLYTIPPEIAPRKRKLDVIRYLLNILSLIDEAYSVDTKIVYQLLETAVKDLLDSVTMDYSKLYTTYDSQKKEVDDLKKKVDRLTDQNEALLTQNYELKSASDEMKLRVKDLEGLSDDVLKAKLQEWVLEHDGVINILEFTKIHKVAESRVERMLNKLVAEGYLEVIR